MNRYLSSIAKIQAILNKHFGKPIVRNFPNCYTKPSRDHIGEVSGDDIANTVYLKGVKFKPSDIDFSLTATKDIYNEVTEESLDELRYRIDKEVYETT